MDRQAWIVITLCVIALVGWQVYMVNQASRQPAAVPTSPIPATAGSPAPAVVTAPEPTPVPEVGAAPAVATPTPAEAGPAFAERIEELRNSDAALRITNRGGGIDEVVLLNHAAEKGGHVILNEGQKTPIGVLMAQPATPSRPEFQLSRLPDGSVIAERQTPGQLQIRKRFAFLPTDWPRDNFLVGMEVEFRNEGTTEFAQPDYFVALGSAIPGRPRDYPSYTRITWSTDGDTDHVDVMWFGHQSFLGFERRDAQQYFEQEVNNADWGAVGSQFFVTLLTPMNAKANAIWAQRFPLPQRNGRDEVFGIEGAMGLPGFKVAPGQTANLTVQIYAGPKLYNRLAQLKQDQAQIMDFGIFKLVSQGLLNLMNLLHSWVGNYAIAIFLLTAIVKAVLWPIQQKANYSMRRMALLAPKMQEFREKYKDDPTRMNQEVMKLYKDYGVNPVSGCLPMMIQIPIFLGLFYMLQQAVELRNAGFLWVGDLSQPDTVGRIPGLDWPINILPLLMMATNLWMFQVTPKTGDKTQQRMLMFMPLIFVIFCYNFASALSLYYTIQNLFTIFQLWYNKRQPMPTLEKVAPAGKQKRRGNR